jgi:hypothetical protein
MCERREKLICMAMDAFRLCIGKAPKNFTIEEVAKFVERRASDARAALRENE